MLGYLLVILLLSDRKLWPYFVQCKGNEKWLLFLFVSFCNAHFFVFTSLCLFQSSKSSVHKTDVVYSRQGSTGSLSSAKEKFFQVSFVNFKVRIVGLLFQGDQTCQQTAGTILLLHLIFIGYQWNMAYTVTTVNFVRHKYYEQLYNPNRIMNIAQIVKCWTVSPQVVGLRASLVGSLLCNLHVVHLCFSWKIWQLLARNTLALAMTAWIKTLVQSHHYALKYHWDSIKRKKANNKNFASTELGLSWDSPAWTGQLWKPLWLYVTSVYNVFMLTTEIVLIWILPACTVRWC